MAKLVFLGTASAVAYEGHENSYFVVAGENSAVLVDCAARPIRRLREAGINIDHLNDLVITHFHPDHVSGLPNFLMDLWLLGRKKEFNIHANHHSISRAKKMMELFEWDTWVGMYPINFHEIPKSELAPVLETQDFQILASPVQHLIPTLGIRIIYRSGEYVLAYSSDTNPIEETVRLAAGADTLIHEAAGTAEGHSTPAEAGDIATRANVKSLYLIHYSLLGEKTAESMLADAKTTFPGKVVVAEDLMKIDFVRD